MRKGGQQQPAAYVPQQLLSFSEQRIFATMGEALAAVSRHQHSAAPRPPPLRRPARLSPAPQRPRHRKGDVICNNCFCQQNCARAAPHADKAIRICRATRIPVLPLGHLRSNPPRRQARRRALPRFPTPTASSLMWKTCRARRIFIGRTYPSAN